MPAKVILAITAGPGAGQEYVFGERTTALIGRDDECHLRFPKDREHGTVSRHHCLLDVNPPTARIRDLGSRNGTRVNDQLIGRRAKTQDAAEGAKLQFAEFTLKNGDQIKLGRIVMLVAVVQPALCADCAVEIPEENKEACRLADGGYCCVTCQAKFATVMPATVEYRLNPNLCPRCGSDVSVEKGVAQQGELLCDRCRADPESLARRLLELAQTGTREFQSIRGYRLEKELGRGGMGAVYLAVNEETGARVALKMMLPQIAATQRMRDLFLREAANMKVLNHRHVVRLHDLGCSEGTFFFTLEYCEGGSVADLLKQRGKFPVDKAVQLIRQALDGLHYAHQVELPAVPLAGGGSAPARGLVHRDIKPHNIFLGKEGTKYIAKIGDYGLAKAFDLAGLSGLSMTGAALGTPGFMPRQQLLDYRNARPEVDVWAMAASLYYMLTLHHPRDFQRRTDHWQVVLQTDAVPIRRRDSGIPVNLAEVIDAALIDKSEIQFKTAAAFRDALLGALGGRGER